MHAAEAVSSATYLPTSLSSPSKLKVRTSGLRALKENNITPLTAHTPLTAVSKPFPTPLTTPCRGFLAPAGTQARAGPLRILGKR